MTTPDPVTTGDMELVREYARRSSNEAFSALVSRRVNLVYSMARRQVNDPHLAEEITQAVFVVLARKAASLGPKTILPGWLCRTARNTAANALTIQRRRQRREQEAYMQSVANEPESAAWTRIAPLLDTALAQLGEKDHDAIVLRFFQGKNSNEIGVALGASEEAAKKRVSRALEKLRKFFAKHGVVSSTAIIAGAVSANSIQAAPVALAQSVPIMAIAKGAPATGSTLTLIKGTLKLMAWTKLKYGILASLIVASVATTTVVIRLHSQVKLPPKEATLTDTNGYAYFVKAAQMVRGDASAFRELSEAKLRALVSQNAEALQVARQGFEHESRVTDNSAADLMDILASFKRLHSAFSAEGRLAEMENRSADAIRSYLDDVRLGQESSRGGDLMVRSVGIAIEKAALRSLQPLTNGTDSSQCKEVVRALETLDAKEPPATETLEQEKAFGDNIATSQPKIDAAAQAMQAKMMEPVIQNTMENIQTGQLALRQTMIAFAMRAYELEKKQNPKVLGDLTPDYLKAIPQDPRTGRDMVYPS
jgi:RNA polymerase sigma factor (sigma-70 family)